jgi:hypothetical protein
MQPSASIIPTYGGVDVIIVHTYIHLGIHAIVSHFWHTQERRLSTCTTSGRCLGQFQAFCYIHLDCICASDPTMRSFIINEKSRRSRLLLCFTVGVRRRSVGRRTIVMVARISISLCDDDEARVCSWMCGNRKSHCPNAHVM